MNNGYKELLPGVMGRTIHCDSHIAAAEESIKAGSVIPVHKHSSVQLTIVLRGKLVLELERGSKVLLTSGGYAVIAPGVEHSLRALEDALILEINAPYIIDDNLPSEKLEGCPEPSVELGFDPETFMYFSSGFK